MAVAPSVTPLRDDLDALAAWLLRNEIRIGWTFSRDTKRGNKERLDGNVPSEPGAVAGYLAAKLRRANIIIPAKASGLFLVDGDTPELVAAVEEIAGRTFSVHTREGRKNLVYRAPVGAELGGLWRHDSTGDLLAKSDGYILGPLSLHPDTGDPYLVSLGGFELDPVELSEHGYRRLVALATNHDGDTSSSRRAGASPAATDESPLRDRAAGLSSSVARSDRHDRAYDAACSFWRQYEAVTPDATTEIAERIVQEDPELVGYRELRKHVRAAGRFIEREGSLGADIGSEAESGTFTSSGMARRLSLVRLVDVEEKPVRYFVRPWLQESSFHVLAARKGAGKGTWLSHIAATITLGEHGPKRGVVWVSSEDSNAQDLRPRLAVAGADIGHVHVVESGWLELPRDIPELAAQVRELGDIGLLVIDPLGNHIGSGKDSNAESDIRAAIGPLNGLADELGVSVVGIRHVTEKGLRDGVGMLSSVLGSSAWSQVPRAVLGIVKDDEDDSVRHVGILAGNRLPPGAETESFRIEGVEREGHEVEIPKAVPLGASSKSLDALLRGSSVPKSALARDALLEELASRPEGMESDALDELVAARTGLRPKSVRNIRAKSDLVRSVPIRDELGGQVERWTVVLSEVGIAALGVREEEG